MSSYTPVFDGTRATFVSKQTVLRNNIMVSKAMYMSEDYIRLNQKSHASMAFGCISVTLRTGHVLTKAVLA
jgi:hypothetical protein